DLKAIMGDKSDNIPGVAGIGEKGAMTLLERYKDIDGVYNHLDEIKGALHEKLANGKENAYFSKKLATIDTNAPLELSISDCVLKMPFKRALRDKFAELEFKSLLSADIFEEEGVEEEKSQETMGEIVEVFPSTVSDLLEMLLDFEIATLACDFSENEFRFVPFMKNQSLKDGGKEFVLPIKKDLLDAGFYEWELEPVYTRLFTEKTHVIAYNVKDVMHLLSNANVPFVSSYDDVSILKCIADGLGNSDGLVLSLTQNGLNEKYKAFGLVCLRSIYMEKLSGEEKKLYNEIELPLVKVLFDMEKVGVSIDETTLYQLASKYSAELLTLTNTIHELAGEVFNVNSTQQLGKILFEKLKIAGDSKKKDGKYKTTAEELEKYASDWEIVRLILRYRKIQKLNSTYVEGFKPLITGGRVHTTYNQANTATGRLSSMNPNLQNIPIRTEEGRELRKLFKASDGNVLIDADYSQIELRLLAHFSRCKELVSAYCENRDIHAITASQVFNVPLEEVSSKQRHEAKAVNFGIIYGISAFGLSNDLHISTKRAQEYINKYFETYSDVKEYMQKNVDSAKENGYVKTLFGRRRVINEIRASNYMVRSFGERAAMNMPLQGSSADIIKLAMINVHKQLKEQGFKAKLVLQVHDELVIDSPKEEAEAVAKLLKREMENAVSLAVPLTVELGVGESWFETK
ncbi:MAG: DNA polymerase I, partial [Clostridiales bacterium]|nr:DNA polymerase I [Clostridiales bacterium]